MKVEITILDAIYCRASRGSIATVAPCFQYRSAYWKQGPWSAQKTEVDRYVIDRRSGIFFSGLWPLLRDWLRKKNIPYVIRGKENREVVIAQKPSVQGITLREDQLAVCDKVARRQRGIILFPTGSGKTVIAAAILSMYPGRNFLFVCERTDLLQQTEEKFQGYNFKTQVIGGGRKFDGFNAPVVISTIQSLKNIPPEKFDTHFDGVIVDEVHNASSPNGMYAKVLMRMLSPIRIGLTATLPEQKERKFSIMGLLGPVIARMTFEEGIEKGILVKPKVKFLSYKAMPCEYRNYKDIYKHCIAMNAARNRAIALCAMKAEVNGDSTLIMVREIAHGYEIQKASRKLGKEFLYVHGATNQDDRLEVKELLSKKKEKIVITSEIWNEGIDIPSLNHIINAAGGKSQVTVLQRPGRGMRTSKDKDHVVITELLDPYPYVAVHFVRRMQIYFERGFLK